MNSKNNNRKWATKFIFLTHIFFFAQNLKIKKVFENIVIIINWDPNPQNYVLFSKYVFCLDVTNKVNTFST